MRSQKKIKFVSFRLDETEWMKLEKMAGRAGQNPNDWCRELTLHEIGEGRVLTINEQILFEELARVRFLLGNAFGLLAAGQLNAEMWGQVRKESAERAAEHAKVLLSRYESRWFFGDAGSAVVEDNAPEA